MKINKVVMLAMLSLVLGAAPAMAKGDTLTVGVTQVPKSLDPQSTVDAQSQNAVLQVNETLVTMGADNRIMPLLADSWKILDDKVSYQFTLKQGVKFHNGETMTADDVYFTFKRALSTTGVAVKSLSMYLADVTKVDERTVILKSVQPMGEVFLASLCHPWASILSKKGVEQYGADYGQHPVGTGRFMFKDWVIGDRINLVRFDNYHGEPAKLKNLVLRTIIEAASRTIELESGAVDMIMDPAPVDISRIKANNKLEIVSVPSCRLFYMGFDVTKPPYDNPKVREALSMAINRAGIIKVVFRGGAEPARGPVPSAAKYTPYKESPDLPYDLTKAKALLAEAGYPNGFKGKILISERTDYQGMATILQNDFKRIGVDMSIEVYEWGAFMDVMRIQGHEPYLNNWWGGAPSMDAFFFYNPPFHSSGIGQSNRFYLNDPKVDALLNAGMSAPEGPERAKIYKELWEILNTIRPQANILAGMNMYGQVKTLKGVNHSPSILNYLGKAYFE